MGTDVFGLTEKRAASSSTQDEQATQQQLRYCNAAALKDGWQKIATHVRALLR